MSFEPGAGRAKMGLVDRIISAVSPRWALTRMQAKQALVTQFGLYDHPERRGFSGGMQKNAPSESWAKQRDRLAMMWDARDTFTHDWLGGALGRVVLYVLGELVCKSNTGDPVVDQIYDDYLHNWAGDEDDEDGFFPCDATGRHRLIKLAQIGFLAMLVDGDHGYQWIPGSEEIFPKLLCIEADRLGSPLDATQSETYIGGITIDPETGRPLSYRVFRRSRAGQYTNPEEIPPANFIHLWDPNRGDEYRGRTHLLRCLNPARDLREIMEAEGLAIKEQSQYAAMVTSKNPFSDQGVAAWTGKTKEGTPTQQAVWGKILRLAEGESVTGFQPSARPTGATLAYFQLRVRQMAISLGLTYGFLWDLATLGGVTARIEVRSDERRISYWQRLVVDRLLRRTRRMLLSHGIAYGQIPPHPNMSRCNWHFGQRVVTDAGYEVQNDLNLLTAGLVAADDVATKYNDGSNLRDVMTRNAASVQEGRAISSDSGVPMELLAPTMWANATQQLAAMETDPAETVPPPGSLAAVGEKGAAQIVDLLSKVATGAMERAAAVQTLVTVYGLESEQAEEITPPQGKREAKGSEDKGQKSGGRAGG